MGTLRSNTHTPGWGSDDYSGSHLLGGSKAYAIVGYDVSSGLLNDVTFDSDSFSTIRDVQSGAVRTSVRSLAEPNSGTHNFTVDMSANKERNQILVDWNGNLTIEQDTAGTGGASSSGATESLTNTTSGSKVYMALTRQGGGAFNAWSCTGTEVYRALSSNQWGFTLYEKDGDGGTVSFVWSCSNSRSTAVVLFEVFAGAEAAQAIFVMSEVWNRWRERFGLLVPEGYDRLWKPEPQILVPSK